MLAALVGLHFCQGCWGYCIALYAIPSGKCLIGNHNDIKCSFSQFLLRAPIILDPIVGANETNTNTNISHGDAPTFFLERAEKV